MEVMDCGAYGTGALCSFVIPFIPVLFFAFWWFIS